MRQEEKLDLTLIKVLQAESKGAKFDMWNSQTDVNLLFNAWLKHENLCVKGTKNFTSISSDFLWSASKLKQK